MILAIDNGATNLRIGLVDEAGQVLKVKKTSAPNSDEFIKKLISEIKATTSEEELEKINYIVISTHGKVDNKLGTIKSPKFKSPSEISSPLEKTFRKKVFLINDANAAAYGEFLKAKDKTNNLVYITISTGIGCGAIVNGQLLFGSENREIGRASCRERV